MIYLLVIFTLSGDVPKVNHVSFNTMELCQRELNAVSDRQHHAMCVEQSLAQFLKNRDGTIPDALDVRLEHTGD